MVIVLFHGLFEGMHTLTHLVPFLTPHTFPDVSHLIDYGFLCSFDLDSAVGHSTDAIAVADLQELEGELEADRQLIARRNLELQMR